MKCLVYRCFEGSHLGKTLLPSLASFVLLIAIFGISTVASALQKGDSGGAVTSLQTRLREVGVYEGPVTGYYGVSTEEAVRQFQQQHQLLVDGIAGEETMQRLLATQRGQETDRTFPGILKRGNRGKGVVSLQTRMREIGAYEGEITGYYGALTEQAVKAFQEKNQLVVDGIVGESTWSALY